MAQHLLDAVPRRLRFTPGSTRNLLLRNISKGDLVLQIDLDHPFLLELGCHQESTVLPPGETLAFRLRAQAAASRVVGGTFSVHIDGPTPPLLVELLLAPEEASEEELQRCAQQAREAQQARAREARVKPEAVQMQMGDAEEKRGVQLDVVPAVLAEYLGEAPSAAALRGGLRLGAAAAGDTPDTPGTPRSEHSAALPDGHVRGALEEGDERPPTPTPEEFREAFAKAPSAPVAPIAPELEMAGPEVTVRQVVQFDLPARSREEPSGALEASYEHVSSKLTPAEATRIAALRAKGLLKEGAEGSTTYDSPMTARSISSASCISTPSERFGSKESTGYRTPRVSVPSIIRPATYNVQSPSSGATTPLSARIRSNFAHTPSTPILQSVLVPSHCVGMQSPVWSPPKATVEASTCADSGDEGCLKALLEKERQLNKEKDARIQQLEARRCEDSGIEGCATPQRCQEGDLEKAQQKLMNKDRDDREVARAQQQELLDELQKRKAVQYELISSSQQLLELQDKGIYMRGHPSKRGQACAGLKNHEVYSSVRVYVGSEQVAFDLVADTGSDNCLLVNLAGKRVRQDREAKREGKWSIVKACACEQCPSEWGGCFEGPKDSHSFAMTTVHNKSSKSDDPVSMVMRFGSGDIAATVSSDAVKLGPKEAWMENGLLLMVDHTLELKGKFEGILGLGRPPAEESPIETSNGAELTNLQVPSFLERAQVQRFSLCFNRKADGVLGLDAPKPANPMSSTGHTHWSLNLKGISEDLAKIYATCDVFHRSSTGRRNGRTDPSGGPGRVTPNRYGLVDEAEDVTGWTG
eukprot:g13067.t1